MLAAMMAVLDDRQKLGAGDRILYRVIEDQDPPKSLIVSDSGDLDVPYLGLVPAVNKTCRDPAGNHARGQRKQGHQADGGGATAARDAR